MATARQRHEFRSLARAQCTQHNRPILVGFNRCAIPREFIDDSFKLAPERQKLIGWQQIAQAYDGTEQVALAHRVLITILGNAQLGVERRIGHVRVNLMRKEPLAVRAAVTIKHQHLQVLAELLLVDMLVLFGGIRPHRVLEVRVHLRRLPKRHGVHGRPDRDVTVLTAVVNYVGILVVAHGYPPP